MNKQQGIDQELVCKYWFDREFEIWPTGGGCVAFGKQIRIKRLFEEDGYDDTTAAKGYIWITEDEGGLELPHSVKDKHSVGIYFEDGSLCTEFIANDAQVAAMTIAVVLTLHFPCGEHK